jgi:hypothetical protein
MKPADFQHAGSGPDGADMTKKCTNAESSNNNTFAPSALPSHAEVLLRSACDTLRQTPSNLITAMALSLPDPYHKENELTDIALNIAMEYGLLAEATPTGSHIQVRLTRRVPRMPGRGTSN